MGILVVLVVAVAFVFVLAGIAATIWVLSTLARTRTTQEEIRQRLDAIEEKLSSPTHQLQTDQKRKV
jgi:hypothetical protein